MQHKSDVSGKVNIFMMAKTRRKKTVAVLIVLSIFVVSLVFWQLKLTGITMAGDEFSCGLKEHTHSAGCYDPENGEALLCKLSEHTHDSTCVSDATVGVESEKDWEATLPELADDANVIFKMLSVATSQIDYAEVTQNFVLDSDGERVGYTRYGAYYSPAQPYIRWSAAFADFCLRYAGISDGLVPTNLGVETMRELHIENYLYIDSGDYIADYEHPYVGDLVFLDAGADGKADYVGIIDSVNEEKGEFRSIIGDYEDKVSYVTYKYTSDARIMGYTPLHTLADDSVSVFADENQDGIVDAGDNGNLLATSVAENFNMHLFNYGSAIASEYPAFPFLSKDNFGNFIDCTNLVQNGYPRGTIFADNSYTVDPLLKNGYPSISSTGNYEAVDIYKALYTSDNNYEGTLNHYSLQYLFDTNQDFVKANHNINIYSANQATSQFVTGDQPTLMYVGKVDDQKSTQYLIDKLKPIAFYANSTTKVAGGVGDSIFNARGTDINEGRNISWFNDFTSAKTEVGRTHNMGVDYRRDARYYGPYLSQELKNQGLEAYQTSTWIIDNHGNNNMPSYGNTADDGVYLFNKLTLNNNGQAETYNPVINPVYVSKHFAINNADGLGNGLFQIDGNGYYYYNSALNAASYNSTTGKFDLYNYVVVPGHTNNGRVTFGHNGNFLPFNVGHQQYNNDPNNMQTDGNGLVKYRLNGGIDQGDRQNMADNWIGMSMDFEFYTTPDGLVYMTDENGNITDKSNPMRFEFSGDDDVMVYVDGVLLLDMSGIHGVWKGYIDFSTGEIYCDNKNQGTADATGKGNRYTTIEQRFIEANVADPDGKHYSAENFYTIDQFYDANNNGVADTGEKNMRLLNPNVKHTFNFFYLERGSNITNCSIKLNIPPIPKGSLSVSKNVDDSDGGYFDAEKLYTFVLYDGDGKPVPNEPYKVSAIGTTLVTEGKTDENGRFQLKANQTATFTNITAVDQNGKKYSYYVSELNDPQTDMDSTTYTINATGITSDGTSLLAENVVEKVTTPTLTLYAKDAELSGTAYVHNDNCECIHEMDTTGTATYNINVPEESYWKMQIRYCTAQNRSFDISVNGTKEFDDVSCNATGGWNGNFVDAGTATPNGIIKLNGGDNTVTFSQDDGDTPNLAGIILTRVNANGTPYINPKVENVTRYEAEAATVANGAVKNQESDVASKEYYVGNIGSNNGEGSVTFTVNANRAGLHHLRISYASATNRQFRLYVNGNKMDTKILNNKYWQTFDTYTLHVALQKGENKIVFAGVDGDAPNLDYIELEQLNDYTVTKGGNTYKPEITSVDTEIFTLSTTEQTNITFINRFEPVELKIIKKLYRGNEEVKDVPFNFSNLIGGSNTTTAETYYTTVFSGEENALTFPVPYGTPGIILRELDSDGYVVSSQQVAFDDITQKFGTVRGAEYLLIGTDADTILYRYEAEDDSVVLANGAEKYFNATPRVNNIGDNAGGTATFTVNVAAAGKYRLNIYGMTSGQSRNFAVTVNDGVPVPTPEIIGKSWTDYDTNVPPIYIDIDLNAGMNTIMFGGVTTVNDDGTTTTATAPNLDKIELVPLDANGNVKLSSSRLTENRAVLFTNYTGYVLPETGGYGAMGYTLVGMLLIATSLMFGYIKLRKRERRGVE